MDEFLSLKWNNHKNSFLQLLSIVRKKNIYTDVTLACEGNLYNVHKIVLSACSDYFSDIFESIICAKPVIILKDISAIILESLLDYMYLGEVTVKQSNLALLIQSAECLQLKGLTVHDLSDAQTSNKLNTRKRTSDSSLSIQKKSKMFPRREDSRYLGRQPIPEDNDSHRETSIDSQSSIDKPTSFTKKEVLDDEIVIKEENPNNEQYTEAWNITPSLNNDPLNIESNDYVVEETSQSGTASTYLKMVPSCSKESMNKAITAVQDTTKSVREACEYYNIPSTTLGDNITRHIIAAKGRVILPVLNKENLSTSLLGLSPDRRHQTPTYLSTHVMSEVENKSARTRRRCVLCYESIKRTDGREVARKRAKLVNTFCVPCGKKAFCIPCFGKHHMKT